MTEAAELGIVARHFMLYDLNLLHVQIEINSACLQAAGPSGY